MEVNSLRSWTIVWVPKVLSCTKCLTPSLQSRLNFHFNFPFNSLNISNFYLCHFTYIFFAFPSLVRTMLMPRGNLPFDHRAFTI